MKVDEFSVEIYRQNMKGDFKRRESNELPKQIEKITTLL
jgi:hypothetical protein